METTEQIINDLVHLPRFIEQVLCAESWIVNSQQLLKTASEFEKDLNILWGPTSNYKKRNENQPSLGFVQGIYFMLIAYAIENMCKAVIINKNKSKLKSEITKKKKLPDSLNTHNLVNLVRDKLEMKISEDEEELLMRLERNAIWAARYPVPISCKDINANKRLSTGQNMFLSYFHCDDIKRIKKLIDKIDNHSSDIVKHDKTRHYDRKEVRKP
jgi:hypothetical protein